MNDQSNANKQNKKVFDVVVKDEARNGRTYWRTIGVAFPLNNGSPGFSLQLHMYPNLSIFIKESLRPYGVSKQSTNQEDDTPF